MRFLHRATDGFHYPVVVGYLVVIASALSMWMAR